MFAGKESQLLAAFGCLLVLPCGFACSSGGLCKYVQLVVAEGDAVAAV